MKQFLTYIANLSLLLCLSLSATAQELQAKVTVNADKITGTNKQVFATLEQALNEWLNGKKFTNATYSTAERIECSFNLIILQQSNETEFSSELQVTARRPVYNASYVTNTFNFRDRKLNFSYLEHSPIEYVETQLESNLVTSLAFYAYVIIGLDSDSFAPLGGNPYFLTAQQIAAAAQSTTWNGWTPFERSNNRHDLITALTDEGLQDFRRFWYSYHRKGLDEMAANADRGRSNLLSALPALQQTSEARPGTVLLTVFADAKLDELVQIYSKANTQERKEGYDLLNRLFPTSSERLAPLKK